MLEALKIIAESWPIAFMVIAGMVGLGIAYTTKRSTTVDPLTHQEKMAQIETTHREMMLRLQKENPKVIENRSASRSGGDHSS